jgi:hypothetical protein
MATGEDILLIRPPVNRFGYHFCVGNGRRVQRRSAPRDIEWQSREIDDATIATVAAQVVCRAHENAVNRARFDAQRAKHALRVIDCVSSDFKTFAAFDSLLADVDAIDWASLGTLIAGDARRKIETMKTAISGGNWNGKLGIFKVLGKRFAFRPVSLDPRPERNPHSMRNGVDGFNDVAHPGPNSLHFVNHWAERNSYIEAAAASVRCAFMSAIRQIAAAVHHVRVAGEQTRIIESVLIDPQPAKHRNVEEKNLSRLNCIGVTR